MLIKTKSHKTISYEAVFDTLYIWAISTRVSKHLCLEGKKIDKERSKLVVFKQRQEVYSKCSLIHDVNKNKDKNNDGPG